jgi:nicotinamidase-related amidase
LPGETVVHKWSHDPFNHTRLEAVLDQMDLRPCRSQIVVTGVATNVCYDCCVTGFRVRQFLVYLPIDATASISEQDELLAFQHLLGMPGRDMYNTIGTRSDLVTLSSLKVIEDPLVRASTRSPVVLTDPLYRAITSLQQVAV